MISDCLFTLHPVGGCSIDGGNDKNKASIPYRKGGVKALSFLTGFNLSKNFRGPIRAPGIIVIYAYKCGAMG
jgi:hypothetical protein